MKKTNRSTVKRVPKRGHYDSKTVHAVLDQNHICHVGIVHQGTPVVIPTLYGRSGVQLFVHGASVSRMMTELDGEIELRISVARTKGLVLARSACHPTLTYGSVVLFGTASLISATEIKLPA